RKPAPPKTTARISTPRARVFGLRNGLLQGFTTYKSQHVMDGFRFHRDSAIFRHGSHVACQNTLIEIREDAFVGLILEYVDGGACDPAGRQGRSQCVFIEDFATRGINDKCSLL